MLLGLFSILTVKCGEIHQTSIYLLSSVIPFSLVLFLGSFTASSQGPLKPSPSPYKWWSFHFFLHNYTLRAATLCNSCWFDFFQYAATSDNSHIHRLYVLNFPGSFVFSIIQRLLAKLFYNYRVRGCNFPLCHYLVFTENKEISDQKLRLIAFLTDFHLTNDR